MEYAPLEQLLREMPWTKADGSNGLLFRGQLGDASMEIPDFTEQVKKVQDTRILSALFRDYTFWTSAYLLEPCHLNLHSNGNYGLARSILPQRIAVPLTIIAEKLGMKPFMEYAQSYA